MLRNKRFKLGAMICLVLVLIIAGCGGSSDSADSGDSGEKKIVNFVRWSNGPDLDAEEQDKVKRFNESQDNVEVKLTLNPWEENFKKIELSLATDQPVDMFYWDIQAYSYFKKGLLKNLQPYYDKDLDMKNYDEKLFSPLRFDKTNMYVAPENYQTMLFYYNKNLFDAQGLAYPDENWTWDDVLEAAKKLTITEGDKTTQYGLNAGALHAWWGWMNMSQAQNGAVLDTINDPTKINFNNPDSVAVLSLLQDFIYKHNVTPDAVKSEALGGDFFTGKIAMFIGGDWDLGTLKGVTDFEWDTTLIPAFNGKRSTPYWIGGYCITEKAVNADAAWEFIKWTMTDNQETLGEQQSWIPVYKPVLDDLQIPDWAPEGYKKARFEWMNDGSIGDVYHEKWSQIIDKAINPASDLIFTNKVTPAEGLKQMDDEVAKILGN